MATHPIWRSRLVFVTSTFLDLHAERDHLRKWSSRPSRNASAPAFIDRPPLGVTTDEARDPGQRELLILKAASTRSGAAAPS